MPPAVVGTAGHIDHGKTALVRALTGVDTDRLPEEKARGITIDLGFAELDCGEGVRLGVVDVPGHEDFIRTMVAGATGMDVVLLVVAADEGVMPQTREHVDIVGLLGVPRMVVALTKADLVDKDWTTMVADDVRGLLAATPFAGAPIVACSSRLGTGLEELRRSLRTAAAEVAHREEEDLARLPVDRSFTVQGTGTVVTGTLWSGTLAPGDRVRVLPGDAEARIRLLQVHGRDTPRARAGQRVAAALAGLDREQVGRGQVVVTGSGWVPTPMLTVKARLLRAAPRALEQGIRLRVLAGTAEVMARCAVLDETRVVAPGAEGWIQLRLEARVLARAGDRVVLRSYSPTTTLGGGVVAESIPAKRQRLDAAQAAALEGLLSADASVRIHSALELAEWRGVRVDTLPQAAGVPSGSVGPALRAIEIAGGMVARDIAFSPDVVAEAGRRLLTALDEGHASRPLRAAVGLESLRDALPSWTSASLADAVTSALARRGELELAEGGARRPGFRPTPTADQAEACGALRAIYAQAGLAAPYVHELPERVKGHPDLADLLRLLEDEGTLRTVGDRLLMDAAALEEAARAITDTLGGRQALGPADFREVLPVSRRHLLPLLAYFDGLGVTLRRGPVRDVPGRS